MRECLQELVKTTLIKKYSLPDKKHSISGINISNHNDSVFFCSSNNDLVKLIYNSIIDYSFNEFEISDQNYSNLLFKALQTKIRYEEWKKSSEKIKYGFFGEVILYAILCQYFKSKPLIARGYFYNPLENSETKGYDSYHLACFNEKIYLWFGEVKFRNTLSSGVKSAIEGLDKALSDDYLSKNILSMENHRNNFNLKNSKIEEILKAWSDNPNIKIIEEIKKHNLTLVYPILLIYSDKHPNFEEKIVKAVEHINTHCIKKKYSLSIKYKLFFILLPLDEVKKVKQEVIEWIESKQPLLS